jgi:SET domain-containing protein
MALIVRPSKIHSSGCYTTAPIAKDARIAEYVGEVISVEEADTRYTDCEETYLFGLSDGKHVIDGRCDAKYINHCCDPNCEVDEIEGRVWITAFRDIAAGEELTYEYNLYDGDDDDFALCNCGASNCRGTMYSEEEMERRAAKAAQSKAPLPDAKRSA